MACKIVNQSRRKSFCVSLGVALAFVAAPLSADVKDGVDAWSAGDYGAAVEQWRGPAQAGDADALFNLAQAYRLGRGVAADISEARRLYAEAAAKGHVKAADNYGLLLFQQGEQDEAMPLITQAAMRGDPRAQYVLGLAHFNGDYATKDWVRAYALMTLSQSSGLPQASDALMQMDRYVPLEQRQLAQSVARNIEAEAAQQRTTQLAAADLDVTKPTVEPVSSAPPAAAPKAITQPAATSFSLAQTAQPKPVSSQARSPKPVASDGPWRVQLGAFGVRSNADKMWRKASGHPALAGKRKLFTPSGSLTVVKAVGFATRAEAARACGALKSSGYSCLVTTK